MRDVLSRRLTNASLRWAGAGTLGSTLRIEAAYHWPMHPGFEFMAKTAEAFENRARLNAGRHPVLWFLTVVFVAAAIGLFSHYPPYTDSAGGPAGTFSGFAQTAYGRAITWWLDHPFQTVPAESFFPPSAIADKTAAGPVSHCDKLAFRPVLPALSRLTGGGFWTLVVANHVAALFLFGLIYRLCLRTTASFALATASTWAYAASWSGAWGFNDMIYGDAVAMALKNHKNLGLHSEMWSDGALAL